MSVLERKLLNANENNTYKYISSLSDIKMKTRKNHLRNNRKLKVTKYKLARRISAR